MTGIQNSPDRATALAWTREMLSRHLDDLMQAEEFRRSPRSVSYLRSSGEGKQKVDFELIVRPQYAPASVQLSLSVSIAFKEVANIARKMLGERAKLIGSNDVIQRVVLDSIVRNPPILTFRSEEELDAHRVTARQYLKESVLPYLDARRTVRTLVEESTRALLNDVSSDGMPRGSWPVIVAAAQIFLGEHEEARRTLEHAYPHGSPERRIYAEAFLSAT
ncbi:hypothetical protein ABH935_007660 [Catenulispora sp. GAS73]|uniref:hypothetical protein n=1 Tax=Catenulispora sp. GAS73 TaxID=3156269 RepID=UPI0035135F2A